MADEPLNDILSLVQRLNHPETTEEERARAALALQYRRLVAIA